MALATQATALARTWGRAADRYRNLLADDLGYAAGYLVGNLTGHASLDLDRLGVVHRLADGVRHLLDALLFHVIADRISNLL